MNEEAAKMAEEEISLEDASQREELIARLDAARAKRAAAAKALERSDLEELRDRVAAEERAARNETAIAAAKAKLGGQGSHFEVVPVPDGRIVIVKRPHPAALKAFLDLEKVTYEESEKFVRPYVEFPDKAEYDRITDEFSGIVGSAAMRCAELGGVRKLELRGK